MRIATVLFKGEEAGILTQYDDGSFSYHYNDNWIGVKSLTLYLKKHMANQ